MRTQPRTVMQLADDVAAQSRRWEPQLSRNMRILKDEYGCDTVTLHRRLLDLVGISPGSRALDVGTGTGWMAVVLGESDIDVVAVDLELRMLLRARDCWKHLSGEFSRSLKLVQANAMQLPFPAGSFDAVFSFDTLHHVPDCPCAISEMLRVCKPTGVFAAADLNLKGLKAVEEVMDRGGETHFDNRCRVETVAYILEQRRLRFERHEFDFVTAYIVRYADQAEGETE